MVFLPREHSNSYANPCTKNEKSSNKKVEMIIIVLRYSYHCVSVIENGNRKPKPRDRLSKKEIFKKHLVMDIPIS